MMRPLSLCAKTASEQDGRAVGRPEIDETLTSLFIGSTGFFVFGRSAAAYGSELPSERERVRAVTNSMRQIDS